MPLFDTSPASHEAMVVKEPVGSFPHDNGRKAPPPSTAQHGNVDTCVYLPDVSGGVWHPMYRQGLPGTISYPASSRLPHGVGVGSPPSLSFFPRLPSSRLPHGLGVGSPPSLSFFLRLHSWCLPHGLGVGSPPSLSLFPRLPGSSLPHGVGVGSSPSIPSGDSLARARNELIVSHKFFAWLSESSRWASSPRPTSSLCVSNSYSDTQPHPKPFLISIPCNWYWFKATCGRRADQPLDVTVSMH